MCHARGEPRLLPAVADASPAKQGLRMPGTDIPVTDPAYLAANRPDAVVLFVPDLLAEVGLIPEVEAAGGRWVDAETLGSRSLNRTRSWARHRPRVGPMLPTGSSSSSEMSA